MATNTRPEQMATKRKRMEMSDVDRLSDLPDDLLLHIFSLLMTRQAVQTCVLSKRWENLWRDLPCLNFNHREFSCMKFVCHMKSFLNLTRLNLSQVPLDDECMQKLIARCPSLEEMVIECCYFESSITITSHTLKKLSIEDHFCSTINKIHISTPSLLYLHVNAILGKVVLKNMASLVTAHLHFRYFTPAKYLNSGYELLKGLYNATYIELTSGEYLYNDSGLIRNTIVKDLLQKELCYCEAFKNLKSLYLGEWNMSAYFSPLVQFVHLSPNLEKLTLCHNEELEHIRGGENESTEPRFRIRFSRLKTARIKCSKQHKRLEELTSALKATFETLEKIDIVFVDQ